MVSSRFAQKFCHLGLYRTPISQRRKLNWVLCVLGKSVGFSLVPKDSRVVRERIKEGRGIYLSNKPLLVFTATYLKLIPYTIRTFFTFKNFLSYIFHTTESLSSICTDFFLSLVCFAKILYLWEAHFHFKVIIQSCFWILV